MISYENVDGHIKDWSEHLRTGKILVGGGNVGQKTMLK